MNHRKISKKYLLIVILAMLTIGNVPYTHAENMDVLAIDGDVIISIPLTPSFIDEEKVEDSEKQPIIKEEGQGAKKIPSTSIKPKIKNIKKTPSQRENTIVVTAYSSTRAQTDSTPCITANGFNVCTHNTENVIAANFLPFGTKVRFPDHFGDRVFTVQDRMHRRHSKRVDVWMKTTRAAKKF
ncbi:MAG: hypothetical protein Q7R79_01360, partial [bacterium]|nr:hypothetical protein [bacterium]